MVRTDLTNSEVVDRENPIVLLLFGRRRGLSEAVSNPNHRLVTPMGALKSLNPKDQLERDRSIAGNRVSTVQSTRGVSVRSMCRKKAELT